MKWLIPTLVLVLLGCAPTVTYDPREGSKSWQMTIDGRTIQADTAGTFTHKTESYELSLTLLQRIIRVTLVNTSNSVIRLAWDESAMVLPNGKTSRVVPAQTTWSDRNAPKPPAIIPPKAKIEDGFYPLETAYFSSLTGFSFEPLFDYPIKQETNIRLSVALVIENNPQRVEVLFTAKP